MHAAAEELDFETAARLRDDVQALRRALEKQAVVLGTGTDADVIAFATDELEAAVQIFHVRDGRVRGQRGWVVDKSGDAVDLVRSGPQEAGDVDAEGSAAGRHSDSSVPPGSDDAAAMVRQGPGRGRDAGGPDLNDGAGPGEGGEPADMEFVSELAVLVEQFLMQFYGEQAAFAEQSDAETSATVVPREVLVPALPGDVEEIQRWLSALRGSAVHLRVPQRGDKKALMETVQRNAAEALAQHKLKRAGDLTARSAALQGIQDALDLDTAPLRIECVDISHVQGTDVVASLVVFEDGLARKSEYRHYAIKEAAGEGRSDDVASIAEVTRRRFQRLRRDRDIADAEAGDATPGIDLKTGKPRRFSYPPNLYVVDGGAPQVAAAAEVLDEFGITDVAVIGLAKRLEEVWVPGEPDPVIMPRNSESLYLLQRVRDEAHRFAITFHRSKRSRRMTASALDAVPGLGESRRTALVTHFGSVARLEQATVDEITEVPGVGVATAKAVLAALRGE
jgi:excinuclease ABC subunit C